MSQWVTIVGELIDAGSMILLVWLVTRGQAGLMRQLIDVLERLVMELKKCRKEDGA